MADIIFVMERDHRNKLQKKFRASMNGQRVICLDIPDEYEFMEPRLVSLLEAKVRRFLPAQADPSAASQAEGDDSAAESA